MNYREPNPRVAGWVLAGGASRRMGRDKARLPWAGGTLLEHVVATVAAVATPVQVVAAAGKYADLGLATLADRRAEQGPLGGIESILATTETDWNLIVACDMPWLTKEWLAELVAATDAEAWVVCARHPTRGPSPLCGVWHRRALPEVQRFLDDKVFRVRSLVEILPVKYCVPADPRVLTNCNEPADWPGDVAE